MCENGFDRKIRPFECSDLCLGYHSAPILGHRHSNLGRDRRTGARKSKVSRGEIQISRPFRAFLRRSRPKLEGWWPGNRALRCPKYNSHRPIAAVSPGENCAKFEFYLGEIRISRLFQAHVRRSRPKLEGRWPNMGALWYPKHKSVHANGRIWRSKPFSHNFPTPKNISIWRQLQLES